MENSSIIHKTYIKNEEKTILINKNDTPQTLINKNEEQTIFINNNDTPQILINKNDTPQILINKNDTPQILIDKNDTPQTLINKNEEQTIFINKNDTPQTLINKNGEHKILINKNDTPQTLINKNGEQGILININEEQGILINKINKNEEQSILINKIDYVILSNINNEKKLKEFKQSNNHNSIIEEEIKIQNCLISPYDEKCEDLLIKSLANKTKLCNEENCDQVWENRYKKILDKLNENNTFDIESYLLENNKNLSKILRYQYQLEVEPIEIAYKQIIEQKMYLEQNKISENSFNYHNYETTNDVYILDMAADLRRKKEKFERFDKILIFRSYYEQLLKDFNFQYQLLYDTYFLNTRKNRGIFNNLEYVCESYDNNEHAKRFSMLRNFVNSDENNYNLNHFINFDVKKIKTPEAFKEFFDKKMQFVKEFKPYFDYKDITFKNQDENCSEIMQLFEKINNLIDTNDVLCSMNEKKFKLYDIMDREILLWNDIIIVTLLKLPPEYHVEYIILFKIAMFILDLFSINLTKKIILNSVITYLNIINCDKLNNNDFKFYYKEIIFVTLFNYILKIETLDFNSERILEIFYSINDIVNPNNVKDNIYLKNLVLEFYYGDKNQNFEPYKNQRLEKYYKNKIFRWAFE